MKYSTRRLTPHYLYLFPYPYSLIFNRAIALLRPACSAYLRAGIAMGFAHRTSLYACPYRTTNHLELFLRSVLSPDLLVTDREPAPPGAKYTSAVATCRGLCRSNPTFLPYRPCLSPRQSNPPHRGRAPRRRVNVQPVRKSDRTSLFCLSGFGGSESYLTVSKQNDSGLSQRSSVPENHDAGPFRTDRTQVDLSSICFQ